MSLKDYIAPFSVWKRAFAKPYTNKKPIETRPGADRYRGFHQNDMKKCIGCGTCESICQNCAIDLVPISETKHGIQDSGQKLIMEDVVGVLYVLMFARQVRWG